MGLSFYIRGFCHSLSLMWLSCLIILVLKGRSSGPSGQAVARETRRGLPCQEAKQSTQPGGERAESNPGVGGRGFCYAAAQCQETAPFRGCTSRPARLALPALTGWPPAGSPVPPPAASAFWLDPFTGFVNRPPASPEPRLAWAPGSVRRGTRAWEARGLSETRPPSGTRERRASDSPTWDTVHSRHTAPHTDTVCHTRHHTQTSHSRQHAQHKHHTHHTHIHSL